MLLSLSLFYVIRKSKYATFIRHVHAEKEKKNGPIFLLNGMMTIGL